MRGGFVLGLGVALAGAVLWAPDAQAQRRTQGQCEAAVEQALQGLPIERDRVTSIGFARQMRRIRDNERVVGYDANIRLTDFDGRLVVDLSRNCRVRQIYTRGHDEIPGIRSFCA